MAVIIKYVVERNGAEKMTFTSKAEADAYDKMLDTADELSVLLSGSQLITDEQHVDALALFLAQNKDEVLIALGAKKKPTSAAKAKVAAKPAAADKLTESSPKPKTAAKEVATEVA